MSAHSPRHSLVLLVLLPFLFGSAPPQLARALARLEPATASPPRTTARPYHVGVQVGHYKNDELPEQLSRLVGSVGTSGGGRSEVDLNLDIGNRVTNLLRAQGVVVDMLPATVPSGYAADAFIAIHADGNASSTPRGFKISTRWSSEVAVQDASMVELLTDSYQAATGLPEDGNVTRNMRGYYAYSPRRANWRTSNFTPGAIVEMGYMTNKADRMVMFNAPDSVAKGITNGLMAFLKSAYGTPATTQAYGYGQGVVDNHIDLRATPIPTPRPGSGGASRPQTGDWRVLLMGKPAINIYTGAGGAGPLIAKLARGQFLHATVRSGDYYQVTLPDGRKGWVFRNALVVQL